MAVCGGGNAEICVKEFGDMGDDNYDNIKPLLKEIAANNDVPKSFFYLLEDAYRDNLKAIPYIVVAKEDFYKIEKGLTDHLRDAAMIAMFGGSLKVKVPGANPGKGASNPSGNTKTPNTSSGNVGKEKSRNNLPPLTEEQKKQFIKNAETISTAKPGQVTVPRDLNEQVFWRKVSENPLQGKKLENMNNDPRFPTSAGFEKMEAKHKLPDGKTISIHYQYNAETGKAYDMKIVTPQRVQTNPQDVLNLIKDKTK